jgi:two-component system CheB/CheR fusion protein
VGVVVVDRQLNILLWNQRSEDLWGLRADEVIGRSLLTLDVGLPVGELAGPLRDYIARGQGDGLTLEAINRRGRSIACHVTFSTLDPGPAGQPGGAVLLMEESER